MDRVWPGSSYTWYRGPSHDPDTKHQVNLIYEGSSEHMIIAAAIASAIAGMIGITMFFLAGKVRFKSYIHFTFNRLSNVKDRGPRIPPRHDRS